MRVVFCGGGTGGHVYPALTVADALRRSMAEGVLEMLYVGVSGKIDAELVAREGIAFRGVPAGQLRVGSPAGLAKGLLKLAAGTMASIYILRRFRPDAVFATGGYGSAGVGLAARLLGVPLLVFLPDVAAGMAVRLLARLATRIAVTVPPAQAALPPSKTVLTGYPVRRGFTKPVDKADARSKLGLEASLPVLLVTGGSTGASTINQAIAVAAPQLLREAQIVHIAGAGDASWVQAERDKLPADLRARYHVYAYLHDEMPLALAAADLAVMRAGASALGELPAMRLPAILIPGEFSDQELNARYLESAGAAMMLLQSRLADLPKLIEELLSDAEIRGLMQEALAGLAMPDAAERLAALVQEMAGAKREVSA
jgi:UDP-N-acetylglucosamine--N-acetylmuramyl-(pentapeptide) pyrophosphoryl-undecaprenol N-acetylglucosamine transferase